MVEPKIHAGGCRCGAVAQEVDIDLESLTECNGSHSDRKGPVLASSCRTPVA